MREKCNLCPTNLFQSGRNGAWVKLDARHILAYRDPPPESGQVLGPAVI
jgi:hypothetical protein